MMNSPTQLFVYSKDKRIELLKKYKIVNDRVKIKNESFVVLDDNGTDLTLIKDPIWEQLDFPLSFTTFAQYGLNLKEALLFSYFYYQIKQLKDNNRLSIQNSGIDLTCLYFEIIDDKYFAYFDYQMLIFALPILKIKTIRTMKKLVLSLDNKGFIDYKIKGKKHLVHITEYVEKLILDEPNPHNII